MVYDAGMTTFRHLVYRGYFLQYEEIMLFDLSSSTAEDTVSKYFTCGGCS